ncbi:MAG: DUF3375 domain-containing protein [Pirellulales bacterium]|nr:DUF3375 domain-containing protein [Pirellulales bacterium]
MHLAELRTFFETSPAVKLLRSQNAPFVIDFLQQQFKRAGRLSVPHSDLHGSLASYREELHKTHPDALRERPEAYLAAWCAADTRWLHRFLEAGRDEPVYELTPHSENVLAFLDQAIDNELGFVGTESRLRIVIDTLADLVVHAFDDPSRRLAHLREEKARIEEEIERIEKQGQVTRYQPAQIRERFATAVTTLKQLQGDFRAVEEKFRTITLQVQRQQAEGLGTRGGILGFALEAEEVLKREDQGVSFYEFVRFILSPAQQEKLQSIIDELGRIEEILEQREGFEAVQRMVPLLLDEAEKVMRTNQRLSATLRRLLDRHAYQDRQRISTLLREIKQLAASQCDDPPMEIGAELETRLAIASPLSRTLWSEPQSFAPLSLAEHVSDEASRVDAFRNLAKLQRLDWRGMRQRIRHTLAERETISLGEFLTEHPPSGVIEVVGYVQIARDDGHFVDPDATDQIIVAVDHGRRLELTIPQVRFVAS